MKAIFYLFLIETIQIGIGSTSCNLGVGHGHPDQIPIHELHNRVVALRGEEKLALMFRYIPSSSVKNVNFTFVQFYLELEQCSFDIQTPLGVNQGFQVRFYSQDPVQEMVGNATVYGVPME